MKSSVRCCQRLETVAFVSQHAVVQRKRLKTTGSSLLNKFQTRWIVDDLDLVVVVPGSFLRMTLNFVLVQMGHCWMLADRTCVEMRCVRCREDRQQSKSSTDTPTSRSWFTVTWYSCTGSADLATSRNVMNTGIVARMDRRWVRPERKPRAHNYIDGISVCAAVSFIDKVKWSYSNLWSRYDLYVVRHDFVPCKVNWWRYVILFK